MSPRVKLAGLTMVDDMMKAQRQAIGYSLTACKTVMLCSTLSASIASALNWTSSNLTSPACSTF